MPKRIIVVKMPREYVSIVYKGKERNKLLAKDGLSINKIY